MSTLILRVRGWARLPAEAVRRLCALASDRRGSIAFLLGLALIPLIGLAGLAIDSSRAYLVKSRLSYAVDAAALAGGRAFGTAQRDADVTKFFDANFPAGYMGSAVQPLNIAPDDQNRTITVTAQASIPTTFARLLGTDAINVAASSQVTISSRDVEVSLVLDITGSMAGQRIADLITAANDLVDIVVQDQQDPFYSKVALVPYSMAVNAGTYADAVRGTYTNDTCTYPASPTCRYYNFQRASDGNWTTQEISTCVTERDGAETFTDTAPDVAPLGKNYPAPGTYNPCPTPTIVPLTSNKPLLHNSINALTAGGSTAGQIGVAWGWYMVAPNFGYLWPAEGQPAPYGTIHLGEKLMKVVIIMTDGDFNSIYYNGVLAKNSTSGSGTSAYKINQNGVNGSSPVQAQSLCDAMKTAGVEVYTVGFDVSTLQSAQDVMNNCATDAAHVYLPNSGTELQQAFHDIAMKVSKLRISR